MFAANNVYGLISDRYVLFADFLITIKIIVFFKKKIFPGYDFNGNYYYSFFIKKAVP